MGQYRRDRAGQNEGRRAGRSGETPSCSQGRCQGMGGHTWRGGVITGGYGETSIRFGTYNSNRTSSPTGYTHTRRRDTASSRQTLQSGAEGGGVAVFFYHKNPPLPSRSLLAASSDCGGLPSGFRCPEMDYCLVEPEGIHLKEEIALAMATTGL